MITTARFSKLNRFSLALKNNDTPSAFHNDGEEKDHSLFQAPTRKRRSPLVTGLQSCCKFINAGIANTHLIEPWQPTQDSSVDRFNPEITGRATGDFLN